MTRPSKFPAKIAFSFCTLFCLSPCFAFSDDVDTAWVRRYNGPGNGDDQAVATAVDSGGNVYVAGSSFDSTTDFDYATIKYFPNGDTAWVRRYDGPANWPDYASSLMIDEGGNVYVAGTSYTGGWSYGYYISDYTTVKYAPNGDTLWVRRFNNNYGDRNCSSVTGMTIDDAGNIYVTGYTIDCWLDVPVTGFQTVKYAPNGDTLWTRYFGPTSFSYARALVVDKNKNVYVTGEIKYSSPRFDYDYVTIKYDSLGNLLWAQAYNGPDNSEDFARAIAVDSGGNAYVTGTSGNDYATIRYDSIGNQIWVRRSNSSQWSAFEALFIAIDNDDNVYVTGNLRATPDYYASFTVKYDSIGNQMWIRSYSGIGNGTRTEAKGMTLDGSGNIYVTGPDAWNTATLKYDSSGNLLWVKKYTDSQGQKVEMNAVAIDHKGHIYATGFVGYYVGRNDFLTIKYSPLPQLKGDLNLDGVLDPFDVALSINCTFLGERPPAAPSACDINCNGKITPADVAVLLLMVFADMPAPC